MSAQQTIFIARNADDPFARVPKRILDDSRLTWKAKGVLAYLLGKPSGWKVQVRDISNRGKDGESAVRTALDELRTIGYAKLECLREGGKVVAWYWKIADEPIYSAPDGENPHLEKPEVEKPEVENRDSSKKERSKKESSKGDESPEVSEIYALYPRKVSKPQALRAIAKAIKADGLEKVKEAAERFAALWKGVKVGDMKFVPHPATFYTGKRYLDDPTTWPRPEAEEAKGDPTADSDKAGWDREAFKGSRREEEVANVG